MATQFNGSRNCVSPPLSVSRSGAVPFPAPCGPVSVENCLGGRKGVGWTRRLCFADVPRRLECGGGGEGWGGWGGSLRRCVPVDLDAVLLQLSSEQRVVVLQLLDLQ